MDLSMPTGSDDRRRVALFVTDFLKYSQTFVYDEVRHHERYQVEVFCHRRLNPARFPYSPVNYLSGRCGWLTQAEALVYQGLLVSPTYFRRLADHRVDLLHAHFGPGSLYALPYKLAFRLPLVVTYHGYDVPLLMSAHRFLPKNWRYCVLSRAMFGLVDRFLAASSELADLLEKLGAPPDRIRVWRLGVEIPTELAPRRPSEKVRILMVGRFVEKKGFEYGLEAFARVVEQGADARLTIIGDGPRRALYDSVIGRHQVADRVEFLGVLSHPEVLDEMEQADILLAPSVLARDGNRESGLIVVKEANARAVPAIGTRHGGIPEIIDHGETGFLVSERDVDDLVKYLLMLIGDYDLRLKLGRNARNKMKNEYDLSERIRVLENHYDEVLSTT